MPAEPMPIQGMMRALLWSAAGASAGVAAGAESPPPTKKPTTPIAAPTPATMNDTVEIVAIDLPELMSLSSAGLQTVFPFWLWQFELPLMLFALDIASRPVIDPAMTPAPASPKPPKMSSLLPLDPVDSGGRSPPGF